MLANIHELDCCILQVLEMINIITFAIIILDIFMENNLYAEIQELLVNYLEEDSTCANRS